jgi:hypothetical protein
MWKPFPLQGLYFQYFPPARPEVRVELCILFIEKPEQSLREKLTRRC